MCSHSAQHSLLLYNHHHLKFLKKKSDKSHLGDNASNNKMPNKPFNSKCAFDKKALSVSGIP